MKRKVQRRCECDREPRKVVPGEKLVEVYFLLKCPRCRGPIEIRIVDVPEHVQ